ncbi:MAG: site-specific DNA-methyltransferase [Bacteroidales bacterium]|nr:site-specific DNA-methyltransferase [Bacteroidales bacterium]
MQSWQFVADGGHRLICGDCTDITVIDRLMDGVKADMVFTDPPYKLQTEGGCKGELGKSLSKQGADIRFIADFNPTDFLNILPVLFNGNMNAYIFCNKELLPDYLNWCKETGYSWNVLIWKKPNAIPIGDSHRPDIEYLLLFRKNAIWNNGTKANYSRCLEYSRVKRTEENGNHPTIKPIELITNELMISSHKDSVVVDLFGGSGSTLIACEQTDRKCFMCELDPHYCDVIIQRWENLTGQKAQLVEKP